MIGRYVWRIIISSNQNAALVHSRRKYFIRNEQLPDIKFRSCFMRFFSLFVSSVGKSNEVKRCNYLTTRVALLCAENGVLKSLKLGMSKIPLCLKEHSVQVVKMCTRQCECVLAHRIRRGQQMFSLYTKIWDEVALRNLVLKMKKQFTKRGKELLLSVAGVSAYNWEKMKISDGEMLGYVNEIQNVYQLRETTVTCSECRMRLAFDGQSPNVQYCLCSGSKGHCLPVEDWTPFLERKDLLVWRQGDAENRGLYAYKVYGSYDDVTAYDFLCVQLDTEYRKEWDHTAVELTILDSDRSSNSDVIYWVMKWPRMFSNRDYVFNRRFRIDEKDKVMVVVSKCTEHPKCPERKENIRVKEYWSSMVIRPHKNFNEPGIEFCLTYFDDPGISIPSAITSWVAVSGLPDFLMRVREAARQLAVRRKCCKYNWIPLPEPVSESSPDAVSDLPSDTAPKLPLLNNQHSHLESQDSYLQLSTARLFL